MWIHHFLQATRRAYRKALPCCTNLYHYYSLRFADLTKNEFTVGRKSDNDFVCEKSTLGRRHVSCSRDHFRIVRSKRRNNIEYVVDLHDLSSTGTFIDGNLVGHLQHRPLGDMNKISMSKPEFAGKVDTLMSYMYRNKANSIRIFSLPLQCSFSTTYNVVRACPVFRSQ